MGRLIEAVEEYAIFSLDPTGAVQTWNRGAHRIKGYEEHEILGRHFSVFYPPEDQLAGIPEDALAHAAAHGQWSGEGWRIREDATRFWANVVITAVFDGNRELDGFIKVTRDETDRRTAEDTNRELDLLVERERIASELSEVTVRELFSATLALDSVLGINTDAEVAKRVREAVATLECTVSRIRMTATGLEPERGTDPT
ncbi:MAG TPA: PAS domain-containing protein [Nocardioides sp.]|nr:PAS domain-containing protein [Nocardioides sp.]